MMMFKTWHWSAAGTASTGASLWQQNRVKCSCGPMVTNIHLCFEAADSERSKPWAAEPKGFGDCREGGVEMGRDLCSMGTKLC